MFNEIILIFEGITKFLILMSRCVIESELILRHTVLTGAINLAIDVEFVFVYILNVHYTYSKFYSEYRLHNIVDYLPTVIKV